MPTSSYSAVIRAPAYIVWRHLADLRSWPQWLRAPYAGREVVLESGPPGEGSRFTFQGVLPFRLFAEITEWREHERLAFRIYDSEYPSDRLFLGSAAISVDLEKIDDDRTRARCVHQLWGKGTAGRVYAAVVMRPFLWRNVRWIVRGLKARVTSQG
jgi:uncharacterized protein YndB with AHSA1/START domain